MIAQDFTREELWRIAAALAVAPEQAQRLSTPDEYATLVEMRADPSDEGAKSRLDLREGVAEEVAKLRAKVHTFLGPEVAP